MNETVAGCVTHGIISKFPGNRNYDFWSHLQFKEIKAIRPIEANEMLELYIR
jgi:hypothetical protein